MATDISSFSQTKFGYPGPSQALPHGLISEMASPHIRARNLTNITARTADIDYTIDMYLEMFTFSTGTYSLVLRELIFVSPQILHRT